MRLLYEIILLVLCVIGLTETVRFLIFRLITTKNKHDCLYIVLPMSGKWEDAENRIRCIAARLKWGIQTDVHQMICLDCGIDDETKKICEKIAAEDAFVTLQTKEEFERKMQTVSNQGRDSLS